MKKAFLMGGAITASLCALAAVAYIIRKYIQDLNTFELKYDDPNDNSNEHDFEDDGLILDE